MNPVKSCEYNMDTACVDVIYTNGGTLSIYTPMVEESLRTTIHSRSKLDWLIENEPLEYARMVIDGTMQEYLDRFDSIRQRQEQNCTERLMSRFPPNIAKDIAREMMMYG